MQSIVVGGMVRFQALRGIVVGGMVPFQAQRGTVVGGMVPFQVQVGIVVANMAVEAVDIGDYWGTEEPDSLVEDSDSICLDTWKTRWVW